MTGDLSEVAHTAAMRSTSRIRRLHGGRSVACRSRARGSGRGPPGGGFAPDRLPPDDPDRGRPAPDPPETAEPEVSCSRPFVPTPRSAARVGRRRRARGPRHPRGPVSVAFRRSILYCRPVVGPSGGRSRPHRPRRSDQHRGRLFADGGVALPGPRRCPRRRPTFRPVRCSDGRTVVGGSRRSTAGARSGSPLGRALLGGWPVSPAAAPWPCLVLRPSTSSPRRRRRRSRTGGRLTRRTRPDAPRSTRGRGRGPPTGVEPQALLPRPPDPRAVELPRRPRGWPPCPAALFPSLDSVGPDRPAAPAPDLPTPRARRRAQRHARQGADPDRCENGHLNDRARLRAATAAHRSTSASAGSSQALDHRC
jgi:hypothetical protein